MYTYIRSGSDNTTDKRIYTIGSPPYMGKLQGHSKEKTITRQYAYNIITFLRQNMLCVIIISLVRHMRKKLYLLQIKNKKILIVMIF